jgi:hypothetical protein
MERPDGGVGPNPGGFRSQFPGQKASDQTSAGRHHRQQPQSTRMKNIPAVPTFASGSGWIITDQSSEQVTAEELNQPY